MFLQGLWEKWWARISSSVTLSLWSFCAELMVVPPHHCLTPASFCAQQLPTDNRILPLNCMEDAFSLLCAFSKIATRGRGSTDGEERLELLKACEDGGVGGMGGGVGD